MMSMKIDLLFANSLATRVEFLYDECRHTYKIHTIFLIIYRIVQKYIFFSVILSYKQTLTVTMATNPPLFFHQKQTIVTYIFTFTEIPFISFEEIVRSSKCLDGNNSFLFQGPVWIRICDQEIHNSIIGFANRTLHNNVFTC